MKNLTEKTSQFQNQTASTGESQTRKRIKSENGFSPDIIVSYTRKNALADEQQFDVDDFDEKTQSLENDEDITILWKTFDEVKELCFTNQINEDRTVGIILKYLDKENIKLLNKQILTIIDNSNITNFLENSSKILDVNADKINPIINYLLKQELIEIIELGNNKLYSHTSKVKKEMLDENLHYKYGSRPLNTYL